MDVRASLPPEIRGFTYFTNHHFIELTDKSGNAAKLVPTELIRGKCTECETVFFALSNYGHMRCPACTGTVEWAWGRVQLCFIAETESRLGVGPSSRTIRRADAVDEGEGA